MPCPKCGYDTSETKALSMSTRTHKFGRQQQTGFGQTDDDYDDASYGGYADYGGDSGTFGGYGGAYGCSGGYGGNDDDDAEDDDEDDDDESSEEEESEDEEAGNKE